jgi:hypothetical protein
MSDDFSTPADIEAEPSGEYFDAKNEIGNLVLFTPFEYVEKTVTTFGEKDAVKTHTVVFDAKTGEPSVYEDSMIFSGSLIKTLKPYAKSNAGRRVLGRLGRGTAKPGMQPPYVLSEPTDADKTLAREWIAKASDPLAL